MKASKEAASEALRNLEEWAGDSEAKKSVEAFLQAAKKRLPTEEAIEADGRRNRVARAAREGFHGKSE